MWGHITSWETKNKLSHKAAHQSGLQQSREESCQEIGPPKNTAWTHLSVRGRKPRTCCGWLVWIPGFHHCGRYLPSDLKQRHRLLHILTSLALGCENTPTGKGRVVEVKGKQETKKAFSLNWNLTSRTKLCRTYRFWSYWCCLLFRSCFTKN